MNKQQTNQSGQAPPKAPVAWDEIPDNPADNAFIVLAEGMQGAGKTHFAMSFPEPIFLIDTENRADKVAGKFKAQGKVVYRKKCLTFDDIRQAIAQLIFAQHGCGTIVIDSGSDLQSYAETEFLQQNRKEKVWPQVLWGEVHAKTDNLLAAIREKGFYCVVTGRLKDDYAGPYGEGVKTGQMIFEGYKRMPYLVDIHLRLTGDGKALVQKNGFRNTPTEETPTIDNPSFETVISKLVLHGAEDSADKVEELKAKTKQDAPTAAKDAQDGSEKSKETKDAQEDKKVPNNPADYGRVATREEIAQAFAIAKELGLEAGCLKMLLHDVKGDPTTDGITVGQIAAWVEGMHTIADEYRDGDKQAG
jgi:hypothetical protein